MSEGSYLGQGLSFPVDTASGGGLAIVSADEKVRQSIWLILATAPGERVMRPSFGCAVHDLVFMPNSETLAGLAAAKAREALERWEPRIEVLEVDAAPDPGRRNLLLIDVSYRIRESQQVASLVYPFFLEGGAAEARS